MQPGNEQKDDQVINSVDTLNLEQNPHNFKKKPQKHFILLLVSLIVVCCAGFGAFLYFNADKTSDQSAVVTDDRTIDLLRVGQLGEDINVNYPKVTLGSAGTIETTSQIFEGLVQYENISDIKPRLATGWSNPDSSTWIFNIRDDVKFHTGRTMTAEDVKKSFDSLIKDKSENTILYTETIKSVEVVDGNKVKITTKGPDPIFLNRLPYIYIYDTESDIPNSPLNGTGPFTLSPESKPTKKKLDLVAFDQYYGGVSSVKALEFISYESPEDAVKDMKDGKLDIAPDLTGDSLKELSSSPTYTEKGGSTGFIGFSFRKDGPAKNKLVREAIQYIVDKQAFIDADGLPAKPAGQLIPQDITGYNPNIESIDKPDINKAKELLKKAGYPDGLTLTIDHSDAYVGIPELQKQFAKAGIKLVSKPETTIDSTIDSITTGKVDTFLISFSSSLFDGFEFLSQPMRELEGYDDPAYLAKLDSINKEFTASKRLSLLQDASKIVSDEYLVLPVYEREYIYPMNHNYDVNQDLSGSIRGVFYWKVHKQE